MKAVIKPINAASLWIVGDLIYLSLPSEIGSTPHVIKVPADLNGMQRVLTLLRYRDSNSRLGTKGDPTQWHVDKPLKYSEKLVKRVGKPRFEKEQISAAESVLRRLGML